MAKSETKSPSFSLRPDHICKLVPIKSGGRLKITYPPGNNNTFLKHESQLSKAKTHEDRVLKIEATLVRVMKARGVLSLQSLTAETTKQLVKWFKPDAKLIKKRIESLMERGFMKRDDEDQTKLHYCA